MTAAVMTLLLRVFGIMGLILVGVVIGYVGRGGRE